MEKINVAVAYVVVYKYNMKTKKSARDLGDPDPGHGPIFGGFLTASTQKRTVFSDWRLFRLLKILNTKNMAVAEIFVIVKSELFLWDEFDAFFFQLVTLNTLFSL